jgi:hypothetical protein
MIGGNLDQDETVAVGILDQHLDQAPRLGCGLAEDGDPGRGQPGALGVDTRSWIQIVITGCPGGLGACPETSSRPGPRKNTTPGSSGAELPVDGQAQGVAVEAAAAAQVAGAQEDPAAQNVHGSISASR